MTKIDATGRNGSEHYTTMNRFMMSTPAWRALSTVAQAVYPFLKLEWHGPKFNNNGKIRFSVRQAAEAIGVCPNTANKAFHELQAKGFTVVMEKGALGVRGMARGPSYEITELGTPGCNTPRMLYKDWRPGKDFEVVLHNANNPEGLNGREIPSRKRGRTRLENCDVSAFPVIEIATARH